MTDMPVLRDKHGQRVIEHACEDCGKIRIVRQCAVDKHKVCMACAAKRRDAKFMLMHSGRGRNWNGSQYLSGTIIKGWKLGAERRKIAWNISADELDTLWEKQEGICIFTGFQLSLDNGNPNKVSLDRIDSKGIYEVSNVQFVCSFINRCKQSLSDEEFVQMCNTVVEYDKIKKLVKDFN